MEETTLIRTYQESVHPLYEYVSRRCGGDRSLAEDVVQEAWLRAVVAWEKAGFPETPLAWLKTVARNLLINYYRRAPLISLEALPPEWEGRFLGNGAHGDTPDHAATVSWGLARLRPGQARIIEAFHFDGMKVSEIAFEFGLSERAVEGRLRRARLKLRKKLEPVVGTRGGLS
jgi:RNA polymerase sigma-70 factor (ECF subfamily)